MTHARLWISLSLFTLASCSAAHADTQPANATAKNPLAEATSGLARKDGLLPVYLDEKGGRVLLLLRSGADGELGRFLYQVYLRSGLGSTPIGLDRGAGGDTQILALHRVAKTIYAEIENPAFRAEHGSADEKAAVRDSFASALIWSTPVVAEDADGSVLVDLSSFLTRDAFGVTDALANSKQGDFRPVPSLTYPDVAATQVFPENIELESHQTFSADHPGPEVQGISPDAHAITLIEHHSLIKLPEPGYEPRLADPRMGIVASLVADYAAPLGAPTVLRLAHRFRLEKTDPSAAKSPVKKPIIFYVDRAAPEPVRSALIDGARWWADAFLAAGFVDAFRVEVLPEGVSPLDARYNVINWVHRQTRGWSYGMDIHDPRTGEIIKGSVLLGSLRVRQDRMIFEGLAGVANTGKGGSNDPIQVSLARLRQLSLHETGHAIGLLHNFAASGYDDRASAMDYPAPRIKVAGDHLDFSDAYKVGAGSWDRFAIDWLYDQAAPGADEPAALEKMVADGYAHGQRYVADEDARPTGSSQAHGSLWDDGADPMAELAHVLEVRRIALAKFGAGNLAAGLPLSDLRRVLVPVYLFHRYEVEAVAKSIGGADFSYAVNGDGLAASTQVDGAAQRRSLKAPLATLEAGVLDLSNEQVSLLSAGLPSPRDHAYEIELFGDASSPTFSLEAAAGTAADLVFRALFEPSRLDRVVQQSGLDRSQLGIAELLGQTASAAFAVDAHRSPHAGLIRRAVQARLVAQLGLAMSSKSISPLAAAAIHGALIELGRKLASVRVGDESDLALARYYADILLSPNLEKLKALLDRESAHPAPPPGMPIGSGEDDWFAGF